MKILWFTWKDLKHPEAGGAEVVNEQIVRRLVADGHEVKMLVGGFPGGAPSEKINGYEVVRFGNRFTVYVHAWLYYRRHLRDWPTVIIDEVNTVPYFAKLYAKRPVVMFFHMLCREIWFYQIFFPLNAIGYLIEPLYIRLLSHGRAIAVSESTRRDLLRCGFKKDLVSVISEGIELDPVDNLHSITKAEEPTVLSFGAVRPMKRTTDHLKAFELAKRELPSLKLIVAGSINGPYGDKLNRMITASPYRQDITVLGRVSDEQKVHLMQAAHVIIEAAVKEGWGLTVTEAASQGTPAVTYDVDGLRDSVKDGISGIVTATNPKALSRGIVTLLSDKDQYDQIRENAWKWSKEITFDRSYADFMKAIQNA